MTACHGDQLKSFQRVEYKRNRHHVKQFTHQLRRLRDRTLQILQKYPMNTGVEEPTHSPEMGASASPVEDQSCSATAITKEIKESHPPTLEVLTLGIPQTYTSSVSKLETSDSKLRT